MRTVRISKVEFDSTKKIVETDTEIIVPTIFTRESILPFGDGKGYRSMKELEAAAWTLEGAWLVAYSHVPTVFVTNRGDIRGRARNIKVSNEINGIIGDSAFLKSHCDQPFQEKVRKGELPDVSVSYYCDDIFTPGEFVGEKYDFEQQNFMFGHVATGIQEGRCPSPFCGMAVDSLTVSVHMDPEVTENYVRIRVRNPDLFVEGSFRTMVLSASEGIHAIIGKLKSDPNGATVIQNYMFELAKDWTMEKAQAWVKDHKDATDAQWTTEYVNNLPDECFAYIEPGGKKDNEGKTVPRSLRHLEYKNAQGQIDHDHVVAALQALGGARTGKPLPYAGEAKKKLCPAAKELKIESDVCGGADSAGDTRSASLDPVEVLEKSRRLLNSR
jgi:hypothetical protein